MFQFLDFLLANINNGHIISIVNWKNTDKKHILLQQKQKIEINIMALLFG